MVERLARAMFLAEHPNSEWSAGRARPVWFFRAETALEALREPTAEMLSAADSAIPRFEADLDGTRLMGVDGALEAWQAMIDAALAQPSSSGEG